jgi:hypothetical protein
MIAAFTASFAQADAISNYFEQYLEDDRFTVVYITGKMFSMISQLDSDDEEFDEFVDVTNKLKGLRILVTDDNEKDSYKFYKEAKAKINTKDEYELLMTVRTKSGSNVEFVVKEKGKKIEELLLISGGKNSSFLLMSFIGDIDLDNISKLSKSIDVDGMEHLDELKKRDKNKN